MKINDVSQNSEVFTPEVSVGETIKKKVVSGIVAMSFRRVIFQVIQTTAGIILARLLFPEVFGLFAIISFILGVFQLFSDFGLFAALIQRREKPKKRELESVFTAQIILALLAMSAMWFAAPLVVKYYFQQLGEGGIYFLRLSSTAILLYNLRLIPSALLEREANFKKIVIVEVIEIFVLEVTTILLVLKGFGLGSFIWAILISRFFAFLIYYSFKPWKVRLRLEVKPLAGLLKFGISFQLNTIISTLNSGLGPLVIGKMFSASSLGLVNWAGGIGALPKAFGEIFTRVIFTVSSRIQGNKILLSKTIERSIQLTSILSMPMVAILMALAGPVTFIVFTDKWAGGITSLYVFTFQSIFWIFGSLFISFLLSQGHSKKVRNITLFWSIIQWLLTIPLVKIIGFNGYAIASLLTSLLFVIPLRELKKEVDFSSLKHTLPYFILASVSGVIVYSYSELFLIGSIFGLVFASGLGFFSYSLLVFIFKGKEIKEDVVSIYKLVFNKS